MQRLQLFLRPPGRGIYIHSTGEGYAAPLLKRLYGTDDPERAKRAWLRSLERIPAAKVLLFGVPSDTGAGILRGANFGPLGVRRAYLDRYGAYPEDVVDVGDIVCVPQLLHDEMLDDSQLQLTRHCLYPDTDEPLPVSPLSITEETLEALFEVNDAVKIAMLGGDHGVTWPIVQACHKRFGDDFGVLQIDAHPRVHQSCYSVNIPIVRVLFTPSVPTG